MGICTLDNGEGGVLVQDLMDNACSAARIGSSHTMQSLIYKGIHHLHRYNKVPLGPWHLHRGEVSSGAQSLCCLWPL